VCVCVCVCGCRCGPDRGHSLAGLEAGTAQGLVVSLNEATLDVGVARAAAEMPRVPIPADDQEEEDDDDEDDDDDDEDDNNG